MAGFYSLIMTCELHSINPQDYLADILLRLANGHPSSDIDSLRPWNWKADSSRLKILTPEDYIEQDYSTELLIKKLGLEGSVYYFDGGHLALQAIRSKHLKWHHCCPNL